MRKTSTITSEQVLSWAKRVEVQKAWKTVLMNNQRHKGFDMMGHVKQHNKNMRISQISQ